MSDVDESVTCEDFIKVKEEPKTPPEFSGSELQDAVCETEEGETNEISPELSEKPFTGIDNELDFEIETEDKGIQIKKKETSVEGKTEHGGDDDGECSDNDDDDDGSLEEGELKEKDEEKYAKPGRQICRFFNRGQCFYGNVCRFLHLKNESKGNYNMFAPLHPRGYDSALDSIMPHSAMSMMHRTGLRSGLDFGPVPSLAMPSLSANADLPPVESAWEKGLREAKELVKKGKIRKKEPDFEEKRLNLGLHVNERKDIDKENDNINKYKKKKRESDQNLYRYDDEEEFYDGEDERMESFNRYENFEMKFYNERIERGRERRPTPTDRRDKAESSRKEERDRLREERMKVAPFSRKAEAYFDPWRRSKSPKHHQRRARSRSFGSFSSVSSYSYSSKSSGSYSRSSSRSSGCSSRSPSFQQKRKLSPNETIVSPNSPVVNKFGEMKKKPGPRTSRSRSYSRSRSRRMLSHFRPSSSRSRSITPSRSISRSRSISMDSVSSASSSPLSRSSSADSLGRRNSHLSTLNKPAEKPILGENIECSSSGLHPEHSRQMNIDKTKIMPILDDDEIDPLEEKFLMSGEDMEPALPNFHHLIPERVKEPVKGLHKQQIKLTLLNKNPQSKLPCLPKRDFDPNRAKPTDEPPRLGLFPTPLKRPPSPPPLPMPETTLKVPPAVAQKRSASSRRDELLKQLKAVEDAIARKRAKFC